jgi:hypothetical protein
MTFKLILHETDFSGIVDEYSSVWQSHTVNRHLRKEYQGWKDESLFWNCCIITTVTAADKTGPKWNREPLSAEMISWQLISP